MEVSSASCVVMEALFLVRLKDNLSEVLTCGQHTVPCYMKDFLMQKRS